jgi:hypothetical protein
MASLDERRFDEEIATKRRELELKEKEVAVKEREAEAKEREVAAKELELRRSRWLNLRSSDCSRQLSA